MNRTLPGITLMSLGALLVAGCLGGGIRSLRVSRIIPRTRLENFTYSLAPARQERIELTDGRFEARLAAPVAHILSASLTEHVAYGRMASGDPYAAVVLSVVADDAPANYFLCLIDSSRYGLRQRDCYPLSEATGVAGLSARDTVVKVLLTGWGEYDTPGSPTAVRPRHFSVHKRGLRFMRRR
jgi:hypothetical protein